MSSKPRKITDLLQDPVACYNARRDAGMSQMEAGKASGLSDATVCRIENGQVSPHPSSLRALAKAYGCEYQKLLRKSHRRAAA